MILFIESNSLLLDSSIFLEFRYENIAEAEMKCDWQSGEHQCSQRLKQLMKWKSFFEFQEALKKTFQTSLTKSIH